MKEQKEIHIGSLIKEKMEERGLSVSDFAHALHYERTNIYKIFNHYRSGQGRYRGDP